MQDIYTTFEFDKIREAILCYAKTEKGKQTISNLKMFSNPLDVKSSLADLDEMISLLLRFGNMPISNSADALALIDIAKKTGILTPRDLNLLANDVLTMNAINSYLNKVDVSYPNIKDIASKFVDLSSLEKEIHRIITTSLTVADKASEKLFEIRGKLKKLIHELEGKAASLAFQYSSCLSDENPTIRDGHFVLPVKTALKSKVVGAIYDVSDTGNTTFIEPLEIISLNNEITALKVEENEEVRRILKSLTSLVLLQENEVLNNNKIIAWLDFLQAKAMYANEIQGIIAENSDSQIVDLLDARHPLLDQNKVVANSYHIDETKRLVIISGPNAGGKTVSLKTIGILVLMNQCGLAVPASKAKLGYFNHIYIDIGDNQSLSDNLSTFSAHMSQIGEITSLTKGKDLILLDELGTGTDPKEGEALALGVVKSLLKSHCLGMISSHFSALKEFALTNENIENSCMIFDEKNLVPTYIFKMGTPGRSYGIEVASRYGIKESILNDAKEYINSSYNQKSDELIATLQSKVEATIRLEDKLKKQNEELIRESKRLEVDRSNLEEKRNKLLESVKQEKQEMIDKAKEELDEIVRAMSNSDLKLHDVIALRKKVNDLEIEEEHEYFNEEIELNDYVSIPSLELYGTVKRIKANKATINTDEGLSLEVDISRLHKVKKEVSHNVNRTNKSVELNLRSVPIELNLIGQHVDEAKENLVKYIDDCRYKHLSKVRIIHGYGSGALRKMTHEYLSKQRDLSFKLADEYEGGGGATTVIFNDR